MAEPELLQILVDTDVHLSSEATPRRVMDALRRQLRHDLGPAKAASPGGTLDLLQTREGQHRMPQGLLLQLTETCRRQGIRFAVIDRRAMVSCPTLRCRAQLDEQGREALRRLMLRDSGVAVAGSSRVRLALAAELIARRQQRTIVLVPSSTDVDQWLDELRRALDLGAPLVERLSRASAETRVAVSQYSRVLQLSPAVLDHDFGMVVLEGLTSVDALSLMRTIRLTGARHLLGLAESAQRSDGLQAPLFLALGGVLHQLSSPEPRDQGTIALSCRFRETSFELAYQGRSQYQALLAALARDEARAQLIVGDIEAEARAGHRCLVLSERRDHLEQLAAMLPDELTVEVLTSNVRSPDRARLLARFEAGEVSVLLATGQMVAELGSLTRPQRLFLTFPFAYTRKLEQPIHSLLRLAPGQTDAAVFDYDDARVAPLHRAFEKRRSFLERLARQTSQQTRREAQLSLPLGDDPDLP